MDLLPATSESGSSSSGSLNVFVTWLAALSLIMKHLIRQARSNALAIHHTKKTPDICTTRHRKCQKSESWNNASKHKRRHRVNCMLRDIVQKSRRGLCLIITPPGGVPLLSCACMPCCACIPSIKCTCRYNIMHEICAWRPPGPQTNSRRKYKGNTEHKLKHTSAVTRGRALQSACTCGVC